jgi:4-diphosphocytidyl-2-C-methyl-D-erythritol kinase
VEHIILSPAKVNLLLKVLSRRPDGYHNLVSVVDIISLHDVIHLEEEPSGAVVVTDSLGMLPEENTISRAIALVREKYGITAGLRVHVEKNIPAGAGLGGGSGNAAAVIKELVRLWDIPAAMPGLMSLGAAVGADVPLFLYGRSCVMRGIGERVEGIALPSLWYIIVYPNVVLNTGEMYRNLRIVLTKSENEFTFSGKFSTALDIADNLENDLEEVAFLRCPGIKTIKERLREAGALGSLMSGSGSAVFGIFEDEKRARSALEIVGGLGSVFIVKSA